MACMYGTKLGGAITQVQHGDYRKYIFGEVLEFSRPAARRSMCFPGVIIGDGTSTLAVINGFQHNTSSCRWNVTKDRRPECSGEWHASMPVGIGMAV